MPTGTVRSFCSETGGGFIAPDGGSRDVFVHASAFEDAGLATLKDGDKVQFVLVMGKHGRLAADKLKPIESGRK